MLEDINKLVETDFAEDVCWRSERGTISRDDIKKMGGIIGSVYLISHSIHCKSCGSEYRKEQ